MGVQSTSGVTGQLNTNIYATWERFDAVTGIPLDPPILHTMADRGPLADCGTPGTGSSAWPTGGQIAPQDLEGLGRTAWCVTSVGQALLA
ncbi:MAG TPA: hypothetical protein VGL46_09480 [Pseudonocardiaceae bacterium]